ncbi:hypothetical protein L1049_009397 [Liquidambar formosana]|uniref:YTH domain-containing family protein n=1 Tax=Liquidambar formosana TaxID=63359 RepID=A0AAP0S977_LIQFO
MTFKEIFCSAEACFWCFQGVYGENGSVMYHNGYGYASYGTYPPPGSPVPTMGHDGQLYGPQQYQYPTYYPPPTPTSGSFTPNQVNTPQLEVLTSVAADQVPLSVETAKGNPNGGSLNINNGSKTLRPSYQNSSLSSNGSYGRGGSPAGIPASGYQDPRFGFDGIRSPYPWLDASIFSDGQSKHAANTGICSPVSLPSGRNQNLRPLPHLMGLHHSRPTSGMGQAGYMNRMYPNNRMYGQCGNTIRTGSGFGSMGYDSRASGRGWLAVDSKYKPKGRGNGFFGYNNENMDGLNELNRGPRAKGFKNQKGFGPITLAVKGQTLPLVENNEEKLPQIPDKEQYNRCRFL